MALTTRWFAILGIGTVLFAIALLAFHIPVRQTAILFGIGGAVTALWLYVDNRTKQEQLLNRISKEQCICYICKHEQAKECLEKNCECCIMKKGNTIVGHSINPLQ